MTVCIDRPMIYLNLPIWDALGSVPFVSPRVVAAVFHHKLGFCGAASAEQAHDGARVVGNNKAHGSCEVDEDNEVM